MSSKMKAFAERETSLRLYEEREKNTPVVIDPNRPKQLQFDPVYTLFEAAKSGDADRVMELVSNGTSINCQNNDGLTCLHYCLLEDEMELFETLLKSGADANIYDKDMWTSLHLACSQGNKKAVQLLLKVKDIDPIPFDFDGKTPMELVENNREGTEVKNLLLNYLKEHKITEEDIQNKKLTPEHTMLEDLKSSFSEGKDLNQLSDEGGSPLHLVVCRGYVSCVNFLLNVAKVNPNVVDSEKWTPLHCACYWGRDNMIQLLFKAGADVKATTLTGLLPGDLSQERSTTEALEQVTKVSSAQTWSKIRLMMRFALSLTDKKSESKKTVNIHNTEKKNDTTKKIIRMEATGLKDTRFDEDGPSTPDGKKRRKRRVTGASQGPKLTVSGVTENSFLIVIDEFEAEWFSISYEVEGDSSTKVVFAERFKEKEFRVEGLKSNTSYCVEVTPGHGDDLIRTLISVTFVTTSEN